MKYTHEYTEKLKLYRFLSSEIKKRYCYLIEFYETFVELHEVFSVGCVAEIKFEEKNLKKNLRFKKKES